MAFNYAPLSATAKSLITDFGQSVTFTRIAETYSPTGLSTGSSTYTANLVIIDAPKQQDETGLITETKTALVTSDTAVLISDTVAVNSEHFRVLNVKALSPASTLIYYELELGS